MILDPTEVIIYRNRFEYELWNSGVIFPIIVACVLAIIVALLVAKVYPWKWNSKVQGNVVIASMVVTFVTVLYVML